MTVYIANAHCSQGVDDPDNPLLPPWQTVLSEAAQTGYRSIELGPWRYLPTDPDPLSHALNIHGLLIVVATLFDDLVSETNLPAMMELTHKLCRTLSRFPTAEKTHGSNAPAPYLMIIDFGNPERAIDLSSTGMKEKGGQQ